MNAKRQTEPGRGQSPKDMCRAIPRETVLERLRHSANFLDLYGFVSDRELRKMNVLISKWAQENGLEIGRCIPASGVSCRYLAGHKGNHDPFGGALRAFKVRKVRTR